MANINDLNLLDEEIADVNTDDLPPQFAGFAPTPKPGTHLFELPIDLTDVYETVDTEKGQRIAAVFKEEKSLKVVDLAGQAFRTRISNVERKRGKEGKLASDLAYLLSALEDGSHPKKSSEYIKALIAHAGERFRADVEWGAFCNDKKDIYKDVDGRSVKQEGTKGCGQRYGQRGYTTKDGRITIELPRYENGSWAETFDCACGASLRVNANLTNFRTGK